MSSEITFGTSGYRGIIAKTFTQTHVKAICQAIATLLLKEEKKPKIIIGFDPRTGNDPNCKKNSFTHTLTQTLSAQNCTVYLNTQPLPTPALSWAILEKKASGGIMLTASHNPPDYNGLKFMTKEGAPAPIELTQRIQNLANNYLKNPLPDTTTTSETHPIDLNPEFGKALTKSLQNQFPKTNWKNIKLAIDCKHGTAGKVWQNIQTLTNINLHLLHTEPHHKFHGLDPNPTQTDQLSELIYTIQKNHLSMGAAHDPDADRHIILDETGTPLTPEETTAILGRFFFENGTPISHYLTTLASSRLIKTLAKQQNSHYIETPVGFKYFTPHLLNAQKKQELTFAVESSGGFTSSSHTLEKCGFYPVLLMAICLQYTQKPLSSLKQELQILGQHHFHEIAITLPSHDSQITLKNYLKTTSIQALQPHFNQTIHHLDSRDGIKLIFNSEDWLGIRISGTEPVARLYAETDNIQMTKLLLKEGEEFCLEAITPR